MDSGAVSSATFPGALNPAIWELADRGDFNGDGITDILWYRPGTGGTAIWLMNNSGGVASATFPGALNPAVWALSDVGDFDGDGTDDILWYKASNGGTAVWRMSAGTVSSASFPGALNPAVWSQAGVGDFNDDGFDDILWYKASNGGTAIWHMNASATVGSASFPGALNPAVWSLSNTGDFDGDGTDDILWYKASNGGTAIWRMSAGAVSSASFPGALNPAVWTLTPVGDYGGDGASDGNDDILWYKASNGGTAIWHMNTSATVGSASFPGALNPAIWELAP
jgi:hypothetical protein